VNRPTSLPDPSTPSQTSLQPKASWRDWAPLFFFQQFLTHPMTVGSIIPTSSHTIKALLDHADWSNTRVIVEYGPGTGVFTRELLRRAHAEATVIAIDTNRDFIDYLGRKVRDPRLIGVHGSAADVKDVLAGLGLIEADIIVSGLPFSTLPPTVGDLIAAATASVMHPQSDFLVYQYSRLVCPLLERHFGDVTEQRVWRCIPPARLFIARKK
jgi:phospholipid N-methyltransferase